VHLSSNASASLQNANTCPLDRKVFGLIIVRSSVKGADCCTVPVIPPAREEEEEEEDDEELAEFLGLHLYDSDFEDTESDELGMVCEVSI
jgi:hypothetical protein